MQTPAASFGYDIPAESVDALESPIGRRATTALGIYVMIDKAFGGARHLQGRRPGAHEGLVAALHEAREEAHLSATVDLHALEARLPAGAVGRLLAAVGCVDGLPRGPVDESGPRSWACGSCPGGESVGT